MANIGYIRVSTVDQHTDRQLADIELDRVFEDKASGKNLERPALQAMLGYVREGDTLHVHDMTRLGRDAFELQGLLRELKQKGVAVRFHKEGLTAGEGGAMGDFIVQVLAAVAEMERKNMLERQQEGYRAAKAAGRITGRGKGKAIDREGIAAAIEAGASIRSIAKEFGVSPQTVQTIKKELQAARAV